ncbi:MAG: hypothetical protein AAB580_03185, partial [Patescibacteria group bacterium]
EMSKLPKFTPESFLKVYEEIVLNYPFALFVHHEMSGKDIEESISKKIDLMRKYGISEFNIHGIGGENVEKIKKVIENLKIKGRLKKSVKEEGNIIVVKLILS